MTPILIASAASAATFSVDTVDDTVDAAPGDGLCADATGRCSVRAAVMESNATIGADSVDVPPGLYALTLVAPGEGGGDLDVLDDLTVRGASRFTTTITGLSAVRLFNAAGANLDIEDLLLTEGLAPAGDDGGAILSDSDISLWRADVTSSEAYKGGGIYTTANLVLQDAWIEACASEKDGTAAWVGGSGTFGHVVVRANEASSAFSRVTVLLRGDGLVQDSFFLDNYLGEALEVEGDLEVTRTTISGNYVAISAYADVVGSEIMVSDNGGGVSVYDGSLVLTSSKIVRSTLGDGLYIGGGPPATLTITDSVFADNAGSGALIWVEEALLERNQFNRNQEYGLVLHSEGPASVSEVDAFGNGMLGIYFASYYDTIEVADATVARTGAIDENRALILDGPGTTVLRRVSVTDNAFGGVELYPGTNVTFEDSAISANSLYAVYPYHYFSPEEGTAVYAEDATLTLVRTEIVGNHGVGVTGAVYTYDTDVVMEDCRVERNATDDYDPGVVTSGSSRSTNSTTIIGTTFSDNVGLGAVLRTKVPFASVTSSSFVSNAAGTVVELAGDGHALDLTNVTVVGNTVLDGEGAISVYHASVLSLNGVTVAGNRTPDLGANAVAGLYIDEPGGSVEVGNTLIASNFGPAGPADAYGAVSSLGGNLIGETDLVSGFGATDLVGTRAAPVRPGLGPLVRPPGGTPYAPLRIGSLARDAGNDAICLPDDQLGAPRPADGDGDGLAQCDVGAVEGP
jgi:hypothetical protein